MKRMFSVVVFSLLVIGAPRCTGAAELVSFKTATATFGVDDKGALVSITGNRRNYVAPGQPAPLLQIEAGGKWFPPVSAAWDASSSWLTLRYAEGVRVRLNVLKKKTHVTFEVADVQPKEKVEVIWWGPYPTTIGDVIGEVVGVVRDNEFAIGIQALNAKTLGGGPADGNDVGVGGQKHDDPGHYADLSAELNKDSLFRGNTAWPTAFGSVLQAFCRDRSHDRIVSNWGHPRYLAPAYQDGGVVGSKIALFAGPAAKALDTIGRIEVAEGLPHPTLDGVWAKESPTANASYVIADFGEDNIDAAIALTKQAGLRYLYHSSPFETWGHFQLKPKRFPHGWDGMRSCVEKARKAGIEIGVHTLSNFITTNDAYVTPKPDRRLARIGSSVLSADVSATATEIPVQSPEYFQRKTDRNTVVVGDELVQYESVSSVAPWRLLGCKRGAWGTQAAAHRRGETVGKLMDHAYHVFLTDLVLAQEVARNIAKFCNYTGVRRISMDGLEGAESSGHGQYGRVMFTKAWYDALSPELQGHVRNDASNPAHYNWHINTYYNWGEPWYGGFRQSQTLYRFKNQLFYTRNLLPRMLGWFSLRSETTVADAEWLLARAAGYDAGFALAVRPEYNGDQSASPQRTGRIKERSAILEAIHQWEAARMAGAFPPEVKSALRDNSREFHLEATGKDQWDLYQTGFGSAPIHLKAKKSPETSSGRQSTQE